MEVGLPVSVLAPGQALNVTIATYDRHLQIAFLGLQASLPDVQRLADLTVRAFDELVAAGTPRRRARPASATKAAKEAKDTKAAASGRAGRSNR
jgi:hypothetical protein